jgi:hypothetical protein
LDHPRDRRPVQGCARHLGLVGAVAWITVGVYQGIHPCRAYRAGVAAEPTEAAQKQSFKSTERTSYRAFGQAGRSLVPLLGGEHVAPKVSREINEPAL